MSPGPEDADSGSRAATPRADVASPTGPPVVAPLRRDWGVQALLHELEPLLPGLTIEVVARAASTNTRLIERARLHVRHGDESVVRMRRVSDTQPCLLVAEHQTSGRGRLGRTWRSTRAGSLTFSLMLPIKAADWSGLSLAVGVALAEALEPAPHAAARIKLKWPNDLWLVDDDGTGRKLGGVLIEAVSAGATRMAVIGIGLNLLPQAAGAVTTGFACVAEIEPGLDPPGALARVAPAVARALVDFERDGFAAFVPRFERRDVLYGRPVVILPDATPAGIGAGVDASGALLLKVADGVRRIDSGEVSVRPAGAAEGPAA